MVRGRNKYKRDKNRRIEGENDLQYENPFETLGRVEENEEEVVENKEERLNTKDWEQSLKDIESQGETEEDDHDQTNGEDNSGEVVKNQKGTPQMQKVGTTKEQEDKEEDLKCALVLFEPNKEEVLPLAIHNDYHKGASDIEKANMDKADLIKNIEKVAIKGDLSPKQINKLKGAHMKSRKQGE
ncbi:hypothetical protein KY285_026145 [Solanum tuberosum]|nr:hypothetical protein KY285_026145 [Solanum tuberosum]